MWGRRGWMEPSIYYRTASNFNSYSEDDRMEEGQDIIMSPLYITGQLPPSMQGMGGWRLDWRSY